MGPQGRPKTLLIDVVAIKKKIVFKFKLLQLFSILLGE